MRLTDCNIHSSWNDFFDRADIKSELKEIEKYLTGINYFPNENRVLRFAETDKTKIKVVIMGMEPYPSSYTEGGKILPVATGRSFEVANIHNWNEKFKQSSLRNILKTIYFNETGNVVSLESLRKKITEGEFKIAQPKEWFDNLEMQGVLFLNASLTVQQYKVKTHTKLWKYFVTELIKEISKESVQWMLWGRDAQERVLPLIDETNAVCCCHPRLARFVNENPFAKANEIDWTGNNI